MKILSKLFIVFIIIGAINSCSDELDETEKNQGRINIQDNTFFWNLPVASVDTNEIIKYVRKQNCLNNWDIYNKEVSCIITFKINETKEDKSSYTNYFNYDEEYRITVRNDNFYILEKKNQFGEYISEDHYYNDYIFRNFQILRTDKGYETELSVRYINNSFLGDYNTKILIRDGKIVNSSIDKLKLSEKNGSEYHKGRLIHYKSVKTMKDLKISDFECITYKKIGTKILLSDDFSDLFGDVDYHISYNSQRILTAEMNVYPNKYLSDVSIKRYFNEDKEDCVEYTYKDILYKYAEYNYKSLDYKFIMPDNPYKFTISPLKLRFYYQYDE